MRRAAAGTLGDETLVVYVSPLKALTNDVRRNLEAPLAEIRALAEERAVALAPIRTAVRTGDTTAGGARARCCANRRTSSSRRPSRSSSS